MDVGIDRLRSVGGHKPSIAVRRGLCGVRRADNAIGAGLIFDDEGRVLEVALGHVLGQNTGQRVGATASGKRYDDGDRLIARIGDLRAGR